MTSDDSSREARIQEAIVDYLAAVERGEQPDRDPFLARHADIAEELQKLISAIPSSGQMAGTPDASRPTILLPPVSGLRAETIALEGQTPSKPRTFVRRFGDYELLEEIARGGMGVVYRARQVSLNRVVALKMILTGQLASDADVQRFRAEAEAAASLDHPNIVPIYEVGEHEGHHYFSMKLIDGGSLTTWLKNEMPEARKTHRNQFRAFCIAAVKILVPVCRAVHHAHQRGILHRDLKPGNILLTEGIREGERERGEGGRALTPPGAHALIPHVSDFGLAKRVEGGSDLTHTGAILGTPSYMAPEQARSEKVLTTAVDIYSLGAILYEVLVGGPPFRAAAPIDTILQALEKEPEPPRRLHPYVDRDLDTICMKCLEKDPQRRYGSAEALADELQRWLDGEAIMARPATAVERVFKWARRKPAAAALTAATSLASLLLIMGLIVGILLVADKQRQTEDALKREASALQRETQALEAERRAGYPGRINLSARLWFAGDLRQADEVLEACQPVRLRGWEWHYLKRLCNSELLTIPEATAGLTFSADGRCVASSTASGTVKIWDAVTGKELRVVSAGKDRILGLALSPDEQWLAVISGLRSNQTLKVLNVGTGRELFGVAYSYGAHRIAFSTDGKRLGTAGREGDFHVWDAMTGEKLSDGPAAAEGLSLTPGVRRRVDGSMDLRIWDVETGKDLHVLKGHTRDLYSLACSPDGQHIASAGVDHVIHVWDVARGVSVLTLHGHTAPITHVTFSPDGKRLASAGDDSTVRIWDLDAGKESVTLRGVIPAIVFHSGGRFHLAFSPDGGRVAVVHSKSGLKIWDVSRSPEALILVKDGPAEAFFLNDQKVVVSANQEVKVLDVSNGERLFVLPGTALAAAPPNGGRSRLATGSEDNVSIWNAASGEKLMTLKASGGHARLGAIRPDGLRIAVVSGDHDVKLWDLVTGRELSSPRGLIGQVESLRFSPDGRWIITAAATKGEQAGCIKVWDARTGEEAVTLTASGRFSTQFSPDSLRFAVASYDHSTASGAVTVWDMTTRQEVYHLRAPATGVTFSSDGSRLATYGVTNVVKIWDATAGQELIELKGHTFHQLSRGPCAVGGVAFSPDGRRVASAGDDGAIRIWDSVTGQEILTLKNPTGDAPEQNWLSFSPNGNRLLVGSIYGLAILDGEPGR